MCDVEVGRARDSLSGGHGFDSLLPAGWASVTVSTMQPAETEAMVSPLCLCVTARKIVRRQSFGPSAR